MKDLLGSVSSDDDNAPISPFIQHMCNHWDDRMPDDTFKEYTAFELIAIAKATNFESEIRNVIDSNTIMNF